MAAELDTREDREGVHDRSGSRLARALRFVRKQGPGEVWRLAREHGWSGSAHFVYRNLRYMLAVWRGRAFDRANGVDTSGDVPAAFLDTTSDNRGLGHQFVPTSVRSFNARSAMAGRSCLSGLRAAIVCSCSAGEMRSGASDGVGSSCIGPAGSLGTRPCR